MIAAAAVSSAGAAGGTGVSAAGAPEAAAAGGSEAVAVGALSSRPAQPEKSRIITSTRNNIFLIQFHLVNDF
jgi:hypothetical protein